jgi:hypothetical protein
MVWALQQSLIASANGLPRGLVIPPSNDRENYLKFLADDSQFAMALQTSLQNNQGLSGLTPEAVRSIVETAKANVGNLTPEERAQVIASASTIRGAISHASPADGASQVVQTIERLANNQGYTGPDAATVVATTPAAGGGTHAVTRGEILDNENFGNVVNTVFTAAGGQSYMPASLMPNALGRTGMPGDLFNGGDMSGIDMKKWSEAERKEFLNKVAEFGSDGTMLSWDEQSTLRNMAMGFSRNGDDEPAAVTANNAFGKPTPISKDDLMENGTFEKQLNSMASTGLFSGSDSPETKALKDAIATANYDELGYEERVALVQAFNTANSDNKIDAKEAAGLTQMLEDFQKPSGSGGAVSSGTTLSNGLVVSEDEVRGDDNFMSMVNSVLDRSGVTTASTNPFNGTSNYGSLSFSTNQSTVPMLRSLYVKDLTASQRIEILEMISQAGSDRQVTQAEVDAIRTRVNEMSGNGSHSFPMGGYSIA